MQLANFHYQVLNYLSQNPYTIGSKLKDVFPNEKYRIEMALSFLFRQKLLACTVATNDEIFEQNKELETPSMEHFGFDMNWRFYLTETGHISLEAHKKEMEEFNLLKQELEVAKDTSKSAKLSATRSSIFSFIALLISFLALIHDYFF